MAVSQTKKSLKRPSSPSALSSQDDAEGTALVQKSSNGAGSNGTRVPCPSCPETFARTEHLARHVRKHTGEKPFVCSWCGKQFARSDSMKRHELLHSTSPKRKRANTGQSMRRSMVVDQPKPLILEQVVTAHQQPTEFAWDGYELTQASLPSEETDGPGDFADFSPQNQVQAMADMNSNLIPDFNWLPVSEFKHPGINAFGSEWENNLLGASGQYAIDPRLSNPSHQMAASTQGQFGDVASGQTPGITNGGMVSSPTTPLASRVGSQLHGLRASAYEETSVDSITARPTNGWKRQMPFLIGAHFHHGLSDRFSLHGSSRIVPA